MVCNLVHKTFRELIEIICLVKEVKFIFQIQYLEQLFSLLF